MKLDNNWFRLFSDCILVNGYSESLIYDLGRHISYPISPEYVNILNELLVMDIDTIKEKSSFSNYEIDFFINQFVNEEIGFLTSEPLSFPAIDLNWESPYIISNAILEIDKRMNYNAQNIINQLNQLFVEAVELRFNYKASIQEVKDYLLFFEHTSINCLELIIPSDLNMKNHDYFNLISSFPRIRRIIIYNAMENILVESEDILFKNRLFYINKDFSFDKSYLDEKERFIYTVQTFCEANNFNLGLNQKVCVTKDGQVKNHISHDTSYGNVNNSTLLAILSQESFKTKWQISNNEIEKCKDCQHKYSCSSNSDIIVKHGRYYKKDLCEFDPYKNEWN